MKVLGHHSKTPKHDELYFDSSSSFDRKEYEGELDIVRYDCMLCIVFKHKYNKNIAYIYRCREKKFVGVLFAGEVKDCIIYYGKYLLTTIDRTTLLLDMCAMKVLNEAEGKNYHECVDNILIWIHEYITDNSNFKYSVGPVSEIEYDKNEVDIKMVKSIKYPKKVILLSIETMIWATLFDRRVWIEEKRKYVDIEEDEIIMDMSYYGDDYVLIVGNSKYYLVDTRGELTLDKVRRFDNTEQLLEHIDEVFEVFSNSIIIQPQ